MRFQFTLALAAFILASCASTGLPKLEKGREKVRSPGQNPYELHPRMPQNSARLDAQHNLNVQILFHQNLLSIPLDHLGGTLKTPSDTSFESILQSMESLNQGLFWLEDPKKKNGRSSEQSG